MRMSGRLKNIERSLVPTKRVIALTFFRDGHLDDDLPALEAEIN